MQITMQAFGWRLMIDRVERPRREARPRRGHAAPRAFAATNFSRALTTTSGNSSFTAEGCSEKGGLS